MECVIRENVAKMLIVRGYHINVMHTFPMIATSEKDTMVVFYTPGEKSPGVEPVRALVKEAQTMNATRFILLTDVRCTSQVIKEPMPPGLIMELFLAHEFLFDLLEKTPPVRILSQAEAYHVCEYFHTHDPYKYARLASDDPVARYLGLGNGQMICIDRPSLTAKRIDAYRVVY